MQIQNLVKFYKRVLKILSGNEKIMTGGHERSDNPNPIYHPPPFSKQGYYNYSNNLTYLSNTFPFFSIKLGKFSHSSTSKPVQGAQKNRLNEAITLSIHKIENGNQQMTMSCKG